MNARKLSFAALLALSIATPAVAAESRSLRLIDASGDDQVPARLVHAKSARAARAVAGLDHATTQFSWPLEPGEALSRPAPYVRESREYWTNASASAISKGFEIHTTAPGALVRLSPENASAKSGALVLRKDGRTYAETAAFEKVADAAALKAAGADFSDGTIVVKLRRELGAGAMTIGVRDAASGYLVHVFEPESAEVFSLTTDRDTVLDGATLTVRASFASASGQALDRVAGVIAAPDGTLVDLAFDVQADGSFAARVRHDALNGAGPGLWEIHTFARSADGSIQRDAKTAFASALPNARFAGTASVDRRKQNAPLEVRVAVETSSASRYDAGAVLYATNESGRLVPASIAHTAAWLEPGASELALRFDPGTLIAEGLRAPYELRDLTLTDQATLAPIERRARALRW